MEWTLEEARTSPAQVVRLASEGETISIPHRQGAAVSRRAYEELRRAMKRLEFDDVVSISYTSDAVTVQQRRVG